MFLFTNQHKNNVRVFTPLLLTPTLLNLNPFNSALLSVQLFWLCGKLNSDETILWSVYCSHYHFIRRYGKAYKIYWPGDLFEIQKEQETIKAYDLVMPLCEESVKEVNKFHSGKILLSTTGCDWELFNSAYEDLTAKKLLSENHRSIVGYVGNISAFRLDFDLISEIVSKCKDLDFVFAGPVENDLQTQDWVKRLKLINNIQFLDEIFYQDVPKLIYSFSVGIIPYKLNSFNLGTNPNKFFEYSAMAIPCVSTEIPSLRKYLPYIRISNNPDSWQKLIIEAINDGKENSKELRSIAFNSSPASSLNNIEKTILNSSN